MTCGVEYLPVPVDIMPGATSLVIKLPAVIWERLDVTRRKFLISRLVHRSIFRKGLRRLISVRWDSLSVLHVWHLLGEVPTDRIDQTIFESIVNVDKEVRGRWVARIVVLEDFIQILDLSHVFVVVFAPDISVKIVDVDPVVAE